MRRTLNCLALILLVLPSMSRGQVPASSGPLVRVSRGMLEGTRFGALDKEVAFLGVPYAAPPVGSLRWRPPQPVEDWAGVRKATDFGSPCPQLPARWFRYIEGHEDCLYLNIWTTDLRPTANRPVLVYFHGGSNTQGYSQMIPLGPTLSRLGVLVVSANYRLGPFGFLAHPALTAESPHHSSGNYGLLDQIEALKWLRENVSQFGGDPKRVTVMGQSAGAVDICLLMASPLAKELFQGAILESGECQGTFNKDIRTPISYNFISTTGEQAGERLARDLGISDDPGITERLRKVPADEILRAWKTDSQLHVDAIVDGWIVPEQPAHIFAQGKQIRVPILVGSNADEATVFGHNDVKTVDEYKGYLERDTGKLSNQEFQLYPVTSDADAPGEHLLLENETFAYGALSLAQAMTRVGQRAYLYSFTYAETGKRARLGAYHGEELHFLSDSFPDDWEHNQEDEKLGNELRAYWVQFAKTGDPNNPGLPRWSPQKDDPKELFELGRTVGHRPISPRLLALEELMQRVLAGPVPVPLPSK